MGPYSRCSLPCSVEGFAQGMQCGVLPWARQRDGRFGRAQQTACTTCCSFDTGPEELVGAHCQRRSINWAILSAGLYGLLDAPITAAADRRRQVFLDIEIDKNPAGRVVVELYDDVPIGSQRFADLAVGKDGVGYRLSKFDAITQTYIRNEGVKRLSYSATEESPIAGGESVQDLLEELEKSFHSHSKAGLVSLLVQDTSERQMKSRLVAVKGKLVTVEDELGVKPNGSGFTITTAPAPELDATCLVIGEVVSGIELIKEIQGLPIVKSNMQSGFFKAAKAIGDKRADVAEKGFGRPFNKVMVSQGGNI